MIAQILGTVFIIVGLYLGMHDENEEVDDDDDG